MRKNKEEKRFRAHGPQHRRVTQRKTGRGCGTQLSSDFNVWYVLKCRRTNTSPALCQIMLLTYLDVYCFEGMVRFGLNSSPQELQYVKVRKVWHERLGMQSTHKRFRELTWT